MGEGYRGLQKYIVVSLSHCLLLFWQSWKVTAASNTRVWERESDPYYHDKTTVHSVVLNARSLSDCASLSLASGYDLFAFSKSLNLCHGIPARITTILQTMSSMRLYKKKGSTVSNTFDGDILRTATSTFYVVKTMVERDTARAACAATGNQLAQIKTLETQNALLDLLWTHNSYFGSFDFWIDGTKDSYGVWSFPDGSLVPMDQGTFWTPGAPDNTVDCTRMMFNRQYLWNDKRCDKLYGYICEIP